MADTKAVLARIAAARQDKARHQWWMNETLRLVAPTYRRVGDTTNTSQRIEEQDDQFDNELEIRGEDFAADAINEYTPDFEDWVEFEAAEDLTEGQKREIEPQLKAIQSTIFAEIKRSNYAEAAQECFLFWGVSTMACAITETGPLNALLFQPIEIPDLLMERAPDGTVGGKWRDMNLTQQERHMLWGASMGMYFPPHRGAGKDKKSKVVEGCDRDWSVPGVERWNYRIFVDDKEVVKFSYEGAGSCPIIACRFRVQADSAWGPGPFKKATPPARVLDELSYLGLKALGRAVDPAFSYEEDGLANFDGGMEAGKAYARAPGSEAPEVFLPDARFDALQQGVEEKRATIRRSCYLNDPEQSGKTPPTLGQWQEELARNTRRKSLPRQRVVREWILPIIERVAWILAKRGVLPPVKLKGGKTISVRPVSPMSKASDLEDMAVTGQVLQMAAGIGAALQVGVPIDAKATMESLRRTAKERHIVMKSDEQIAAEQATEVMAQGGMDAVAPPV